MQVLSCVPDFLSTGKNEPKSLHNRRGKRSISGIVGIIPIAGALQTTNRAHTKMKKASEIRLWVRVVLLGGLAMTAAPARLPAQSAALASPSTTQSLLDKASAFEARGRMDMAKQTWEQVLASEPKNADALADLARAARIEGNSTLANSYLDKLRALNPNDPNIARVQSMTAQQTQAEQLQQAGKLAESGQYVSAMVVYREVFGATPPAGDWALAYYETESATEDGRPHAIAGLRALVEKDSSDPRYQIALGRVLTYDPKTREEGRSYLHRYPNDQRAQEALRLSLLWDTPNPAMTPQIRTYLASHHDSQLAQALLVAQTPQASPSSSATAAQITKTTTPPATIQRVAQLGTPATVGRVQSADEATAFRALNAQHLDEAETRFKAILAVQPANPRALAGMGYVRMQQGNFTGAISFLEQAKLLSPNDGNINAALDTSRFWFVMGEGRAALENDDLASAEKRYRAALALRPGSADATAGLAGTLLKAQQPAAAIPLFQSYLKMRPASADGWGGLFLAEFQVGNAPQALATEKQIPSSARAELAKDPVFLQALASAYSAVGRDSDAQKTLADALANAFPADAMGMKKDTQLRFAAMLLAANRLDQAAAQYRQVLAGDHANTPAWQGLVRAEHGLGHDAVAMQTVESMPPASYEIAMHDPGFEATVAAVYRAVKKYDVAQALLDKALVQQTTAGQRPSPEIEMQLAELDVERGNAQLAFPIYQTLANDYPDHPDAWAGLLSVLHSTGHDKDAAERAQLMPAPVRAQLETNIGYLRTMASIYGALGQARDAAQYLGRAEQYYAAAHKEPPADVAIQNAWLLFNGMDDGGLYRQLMTLGGRPDLTAEQRRTIQTIWTDWAVRRANQSAAAGDPKRALAILNAAARSFPDNPAVVEALAKGYAHAGEPTEAVQIYKARDMKAASVGDYRIAVDAALSANDNKDAESWLRYALKAYPEDPQLLILAARFEQTRGNATRAIAYYQHSLNTMPAADPGVDLAMELSAPPPLRLPGPDQAQDLSTLLAPGAVSSSGAQGGQPYLPSYGNIFGVGPVTQPGGVVPPYMTNPDFNRGPAPAPSAAPGAGATPKGPSPPQSRSEKEPARGTPAQSRQADVQGIVRSAVDVALEHPAAAGDGTASRAASPAAPAATPQAYQQQQVVRLTQQAATQTPTASATDPANQSDIYFPYVPYLPPYVAAPVTPASATPAGTASPAPNPAVVTVHLGDDTPHPAPPLAEMTDVIPTPRNVGNGHGADPLSSHPDIAAAQAASIRRRQSDPDYDRSGQSLPVDVSPDVTIEDAVYSQPPLLADQHTQQLPQPSAKPSGQPGGAGDPAQQYPQPHTAPNAAAPAPRVSAPTHSYSGPPPSYASAAPSRRPDRAQDHTTYQNAPPPPPALPSDGALPLSTIAPVATAAQASLISGAMYSPGVGQPLGGQPYPPLSQAYPFGPPSGAQLIETNLPPVGLGGMNAQAPLPISQRQDAQDSLASLQGSYSGWLGGTGIGRYRSGTAGLDRLTDVETPAEASAALGRAARLTLVAVPVFLNSGKLNPSNFSGYSANAVPYLGTLPANVATPPAQQSVYGTGGELQLTTKNLGLAAGYTPYEFLVDNITARFNWRPWGGPITFFGDRAAVKDTQLSYAGMNDPGTASPTYAGNIWGGVVSTTGGIKLGFGRANSGNGFYLSADAGLLKGDHVQTNQKLEGASGATFRAKNWGAGSLTVGAMVFAMHYQHNESGMTYGEGGYFSPRYYGLASVPITISGRGGSGASNFHYAVGVALGVQTFQQAEAPFFPLDPSLESALQTTLACTPLQAAAHTCAEYPATTSTAFTYAANSEVSYLFGRHWYIGGFAGGDNTRNFNDFSGGFFFRYVFRKQHEADGFPSGLFPVQGFRPVRIP
jgi:tetratricopeptide (TPR) repeat protein